MFSSTRFLLIGPEWRRAGAAGAAVRSPGMPESQMRSPNSDATNADSVVMEPM